MASTQQFDFIVVGGKSIRHPDRSESRLTIQCRRNRRQRSSRATGREPRCEDRSHRGWSRVSLTSPNTQTRKMMFTDEMTATLAKSTPSRLQPRLSNFVAASTTGVSREPWSIDPTTLALKSPLPVVRCSVVAVLETTILGFEVVRGPLTTGSSLVARIGRGRTARSISTRLVFMSRLIPIGA